MIKKTEKASTEKHITIKAPDLRTVTFNVRGDAPLVVHRFWQKGAIEAGMEQDPTEKSKKKKREARDYHAEYMAARHVSTEGWEGFQASGIRCAMIDACRLVGFHMTKAKMSVFVPADGYGLDGKGLIRIYGLSEEHRDYARNDNGSVDIRSRPMYKSWGAQLRIRYDAEQFNVDDVTHLLMRAGMQVGICEGRPFSKNSAGQGWGTFEIVNEDVTKGHKKASK